jgi:mycothiol S-conjugate amidase
MTLLHEAMLEATGESPYTEWLKEWEERREGQDWPDPDQRITTKVPCGEFFEVRDDALRAHATQVDPDSFWFAVPLPVQQKIWPTEDFELVKSFVDTATPEDDLFTGVR